MDSPGGGGLILALALVAGVPAEAAGQVTEIWVDTDNGDDDLNDGSESEPYLTLNKALQEAYDLRFTANGCAAPTATSAEVVVKVIAASTPVAPDGFGGNESWGWLRHQDRPPCASITRPPFPIRMVEGVVIEGISTAGVKPRITIDEDGGASTFSWTVNPPLRAYLYAASDAELVNFLVDGAPYHYKHSARPVGLFATGVNGVVVQDCDFIELYDGAYFDARPGQQITATVDSCSFEGMGPLRKWDDTENEEQGHAGIWVTGGGSVVLSLWSSYFEGCHDAIEIAVEEMTYGRMTVYECDFFRNENGLEVVGTGDVEVVVGGCSFTENVNMFGGMPYFVEDEDDRPLSPAAIAIRSEDLSVKLSATECSFENNAFGAMVFGDVTLWMGDDESPGLNTFEPFDFNLFTSGDDPYRVCLYSANVFGHIPTVIAAGNTWVPSHQGADSSGCLTGVVAGPVNLVPSPMNSQIIAPPGPTVGECCDPATDDDWLRNFSVEEDCEIDFGTDCLP